MGLVVFLTSFAVNAADVLFMQVYQDGKLIQLEPGGQLYHVAIRYKGQWLHAHTHNNVDLVDSMEIYGDRFILMSHPDFAEPTDEYVKYWVGKPFDRTYDWNNPDANYCTRLIAQVPSLNIPPGKAWFAGKHWSKQTVCVRGREGMGPDDLFTELFNRGFRPPVADCAVDLEALERPAYSSRR